MSVTSPICFELGSYYIYVICIHLRNADYRWWVVSTTITWRVPLEEDELNTLSEHTSPLLFLTDFFFFFVNVLLNL